MAKTTTSKNTGSSLSNNKTIFDKIEVWGANNYNKLLFTFLGLSIFFSFMLFNARISEAHDDALYLEGGWLCKTPVFNIEELVKQIKEE